MADTKTYKFASPKGAYIGNQFSQIWGGGGDKANYGIGHGKDGKEERENQKKGAGRCNKAQRVVYMRNDR